MNTLILLLGAIGGCPSSGCTQQYYIPQYHMPHTLPPVYSIPDVTGQVWTSEHYAHLKKHVDHMNNIELNRRLGKRPTQETVQVTAFRFY